MLQHRRAAVLASAVVVPLALAGCGTAVHQVRSAAAASALPATAAPSATGSPSTVSSRCVTGFVTVNPETGQAVSFVPFTDLSAFRPGPDVHGGYQLKLTDTSGATAEVGGFSVAFYEGGSEVGSATEGPFTSPDSITDGKSLTWTETTKAMNVGATGAVATNDTCALVQWTHP